MMGIIVHSRAPWKADANPLDAQRCRLRGGLGGSRHERRVTAIAMRLFDLLRPQHGLSGKYRHLLRIAALLHDAGKVHGAALHEVRGAELMLSDRSLPLSPRQRRAVAYLIRYHRGTVPAEVGDQQILLPRDKHGKLRIILAILRAADALDSRRIRPCTIIIKRSSRKLRICCLVADDLAEARRRLGGKFELLEEELGLRVKLRIKRVLMDG